MKKIKTRNDNGKSERFLKVFGDLVEAYLEYKRFYETTDNIKRDIVTRLALIDDIKENGVKEPITILEEKEGFEIDGYHRLIISDKLGHKRICIK